MFLSDRDIKYAIESGKLIVDPPPESFADGGYDENSIDLHLDAIEFAKVWDIGKAVEAQRRGGGSRREHVLELGDFDYNEFADTCLTPVPSVADPATTDRKVYSRGQEIIVRPTGFLLWTTKEVVGTPKDNPELVSFVNAKSTKARTGIMVHFTAPTINSGWEGKITLEIINLGPFTLLLRPGDVIAQHTVATISSRPDPNLRHAKKSATMNQIEPGGRSS